MLLATRENMRKFEDRRDVVAYSEATGEEVSAHSDDYFWLPAGQPLTDEDGCPMILARRSCSINPL